MKQFTPLSKSCLFTAATSAPTGIQCLVEESNQNYSDAGNYRIVNTGTVAVWLGVGKTGAIAATNAAIASSGSPANGVLLLAGAAEVFRFSQAAYFSGITASGTADVVLSQGNGE